MYAEQRVRRAGAALDGALLVGIAAIFLVNAVSAAVAPATFAHLLEDSPLTRAIGAASREWLVTLIGVNDALVAAAALVAVPLRRVRRAVLAWAGGWLGVAAVLKLTALV